ncbi:MAG: hypothetical protein IJV00_05725 [Clostridia bacterium]|nr:hypothetical protein [Clostridia bacterium]
MKLNKSDWMLILKTLVYQIALSLLGMMLGTATGSFSALRLIGAVCAVAVYLYIIGLQFWNKGSHDAVKGEPKKFPPKGVLTSFIAFAPSIVCVLICASLPMADATGAANWVFALFAVTKLCFMGVYFGFAAVLYPTNAQMTQAQMIAASQSQASFFAVAVFLAFIVGALCYALGYNNRDVLNLFSKQSKQLR